MLTVWAVACRTELVSVRSSNGFTTPSHGLSLKSDYCMVSNQTANQITIKTAFTNLYHVMVSVNLKKMFKRRVMLHLSSSICWCYCRFLYQVHTDIMPHQDISEITAPLKSFSHYIKWQPFQSQWKERLYIQAGVFQNVTKTFCTCWEKILPWMPPRQPTVCSWTVGLQTALHWNIIPCHKFTNSKHENWSCSFSCILLKKIVRSHQILSQSQQCFHKSVLKIQLCSAVTYKPMHITHITTDITLERNQFCVFHNQK